MIQRPLPPASPADALAYLEAQRHYDVSVDISRDYRNVVEFATRELAMGRNFLLLLLFGGLLLIGDLLREIDWRIAVVLVALFGLSVLVFLNLLKARVRKVIEQAEADHDAALAAEVTRHTDALIRL